MKEKDIVEHLLNKMRELLELTQENIEKEYTSDLPDDLDAKLDKLEEDVETFCRVSEELMQKEGISDQEIKQILKKPSQNVNPKRQRILQKARKLRSELEHTQRSISSAASHVKKQQDIHGKKGSKTGKKIARKKKFKRVGGKDGWMPL